MKKFFALLAAICIAAVMLVPVSADFSSVNLSLPVKTQGAKVSFWYIADTNKEFTQDFSQCSVSIDKVMSGDADTALTLAGYANKQKLSPASTAASSSDGVVTAKLAGGVYLAVPDAFDYNGRHYEAAPFIVVIPANSADRSIDISPKYTSSEIQKYKTITVEKLWKGASDKDWKSTITAEVYADGKLFATVTLSQADSWKQSVENIPYNAVVTVSEQAYKGFICTVSHNGNVYTLTNTKIGFEDETSKPSGGLTNPIKTTVVPGGGDEHYTGGNNSGGGHNTTIYTAQSRPSDSNGNTSPSDSDSSKLPQTGLRWWPVPAAAFIGIILIITGISMRKKKEAD